MVNEETFEGFKRLVETVKARGVVFSAHLNHAGRAATPKVIGGTPLAPSPVLCPATGAVPTEISRDDIDRIKKAYGRTASLCSKAGVDFIEVQMGHGYLVHQFYSLYLNHRSDEYGGPSKIGYVLPERF